MRLEEILEKRHDSVGVGKKNEKHEHLIKYSETFRYLTTRNVKSTWLLAEDGRLPEVRAIGGPYFGYLICLLFQVILGQILPGTEASKNSHGTKLFRETLSVAPLLRHLLKIFQFTPEIHLFPRAPP